MSSTLLMQPTKYHNLQDDLESFFYLVLYLSICKLPFATQHGYNKKAIIEDIFAHCTYVDTIGIYMGGAPKFAAILYFANSCLAGLSFTDNKPLTDLLISTVNALEEYLDHMRAVEKAKGNKTKTQDLKEEFKTLNLHDHEYLIALFNKALGEVGWPDNKLPTPIPKARLSPSHTRNTAKRSKGADDDEFELSSQKKAKTASGSAPATRSSTRRQAQAGGNQPSGSGASSGPWLDVQNSNGGI